MSRQQLRERNEQLLQDYDAMPPGRRFHLIGRYGFKDMRCVYSQVWIIRKRKAAAPIPREASCDPETGRAEGERVA